MLDKLTRSFGEQKRRAIEIVKERLGKRRRVRKAGDDDKTAEELAAAIFKGMLDELRKLPQETTAALEEAAQSGIAAGIAQINITDTNVINSLNALARDWASKRAAEMVGMKWVDGKLVPNPNAEWVISDTTRDDIRSIVTHAFEQETPMADLIGAIQDAGAFSDSRAEMIARTEVSFAQVTGNYDVWQASGTVAGTQWLMSEDHEIEDECDDNDGEMAAIGDMFPSGDMMPPAHPNCWCVLRAVFADEMNGEDTGEEDTGE